MRDGNAIEVTNVEKNFRVYLDKGNMLKERMIAPWRNRYEDRKVLKGISFDVKVGEAIGIIGKNGCGKSTTLKLLTKILRPNAGTIEVKGRVSSLIELGAGFHQDMSGRENIYINASIFGLKRKEIDRRMDDIIRFSELEEYIDNPVRTYSSGMYMRLAFSIAINVDADVLLIDEILAVGDSSFQTKCFKRLEEIKRNGTTIVIVSHSMDQMYRICDKLVWLEEGHVKKIGSPMIVGEEYLALMEEKRLQRLKEELGQKEDAAQKESIQALNKDANIEARRSGSGLVTYQKVTLYNEKGEETTELKTGEKIRIELEYASKVKEKAVAFSIGFTREDGVYCYGTSVELNGIDTPAIQEKGKVVVELENKLLQGEYMLDLFLEMKDAEQRADEIISVLKLKVDSKQSEKKNDVEAGIFTMPHKWSV